MALFSQRVSREVVEARIRKGLRPNMDHRDVVKLLVRAQ